MHLFDYLLAGPHRFAHHARIGTVPGFIERECLHFELGHRSCTSTAEVIS